MTRRAATDQPGSGDSPAGPVPLPLNLDFMFGKGFLWAEDVELSEWLTLVSLRMEIPDLTFPFDAGGGVERFRDTRCQVREIELAIDEAGLARRLADATDSLAEFHDLRVQFLEDTVHVSLQLRAFGSETHLSFRGALLPPEPPRSDEIHLSLYDYRWFGPLPYPGRLLAFEWMTGVLDTPLFSAPGEGRPFQVGVAGDIASFRPFKLLLVDLFPAHGWKLPNLSGVVLDDVRIEPGRLLVRASSQEGRWESEAEPMRELRNSREGRRALAAYESKDLFAPADEALFAGHLDEALRRLSNYRETYGLHPQLASRLLDCLLADPTTSHLAEANSICRELIEDNPDDLRSHLARPVMTMVSRGDRQALEAFEALAEVLKKRGDTTDWALAELAVADILEQQAPEQAADRLREVIKAVPESLPVLERLRALARRLGDQETLEEVLKRLTGVYTDRRKLRETYLALARHLMHREGELGEARHYLQKALNIDSEHLEALETLGESYELSDKPMRAIKALSSAARIAESRQQLPRARALQFRIARLWRRELEEPEQALLSVRRAISTTESELEAASSLGRPQAIEFARQLEFAAELCEQLSRPDEALGHWSEAVSLLQRLVDADDIPGRALGEGASPDADSPIGRLARAHRHLARLYIERGRHSAAESHWQQVLQFDPGAADVVAELEAYYKKAGRAETLLELLEERLALTDDPSRTANTHRKLADVHEALGDEKRAESHREQADELARRRDVDRPDNPWRHDLQTEPVVESLGARAESTADSSRPPPSDEPRATNARAEETDERRTGDAPPSDETPRPPDARDKNDLFERSNAPEISHRKETPESGLKAIDIDETLDEAEPAGERADDRPTSEDGSGSEERRSSSFELPSLDIDPESSGFGRTDDEQSDEHDHPTRRVDRATSRSLVEDTEIDEEESADDAPDTPDEPVGGEPAGLPDPQGLEEPSSESAAGAAEPESEAAPEQRATSEEELDDEELESFRAEYRDLLTGEADPADASGEGGDPDALAPPAQGSDDDAAGPPEASDGDDEESIGLPAPSSVAESSDEEAPEPSEQSDDEGDPPAISSTDFKEKLKEAAARKQSSPSSDEEAGAETVRADAPPSVDERIRTARNSGDDERLAEVLDEILTAREEDPDGVDLTDERALELRRELAELYYYDLQDGEAARPHLERLRERDPEGLGADPEILRALETLYEQDDDLEGRIAILEQQRALADTDAKKATYCMLLAQLHWDDRDDPEEADRLLEATLERDPDHAGAHRLLADVAADRGEFRRAADHLATALQLGGDGLDALERRRQLAELLADRLDEPEAAADHYAQILEQAPAESRALEGLKACRRRLDDWEGYLETLRRELAVELGHTEPVAFDDVVDLDPDLVGERGRIAASRIIAEAADIHRDRLEAPERAHELYGWAVDLWGEHFEALEARVELDRTLDKRRALTDDLARYADGLLDASERFDALREAAELARELERRERAAELAERAVEAAELADSPPEGLAAVREMFDEETHADDTP